MKEYMDKDELKAYAKIELDVTIRVMSKATSFDEMKAFYERFKGAIAMLGVLGLRVDDSVQQLALQTYVNRKMEKGWY